MNRTAIISSILVAVAAPAESKTRYTMQATPTEGQTSYWEKGTQYLRDVQIESVIEISNNRDELPDRQSTLRLYIVNKSEVPVNFGPDNIRIELAGGKIATIYTYDELSAKARRDIKRRKTLAIIANAFSAQGADGYQSGSFDYSGTTDTGVRVSGNGTYSTHDPALAREQQAEVERQAQATSQAIQSRSNNAKQALDRLIQTTTLQPGEQLGGIVAYDLPSGFESIKNASSVTVVIRVGKEVHRVVGTMRRAE